jgi:drug/metabolite transporter (DMT)-like permease
MLDSILELLGNLLSFNFSQFTENIVTLALSAFAVILGFFSIAHLRRRRQTLDHERMAAILKGLHYAGVSRDVFKKPAADSQDHLLRGLRWLFGGVGVSGALYTYGSIEPVADTGAAIRGALIGLIPGALGLAHLLFSWFCKRAHDRQQDALSSRMVYRAAARRY